MLRRIRERVLFFILMQLMRGGDSMNEQIKKAFATTLVHLILAGRREIEDVPVALRDLVKADLGITEPTQVAPAVEQITEQEA